ncbi:MAG: hypothetical protein ACFCU5_07390 [Pleurocapsa sp.]
MVWGYVLEDLTTLEINTAIVAEIVAEVFIPWEVYHSIYSISRASLVVSAVDLSLHDRYLQLRRQLELAYNLLLIDPNSQLYDRVLVAEIKRNLPLLASSDSSWETIATKLPPSISRDHHKHRSALNKLLKEPSFLTTLRQLNNAKALLDRRDRNLQREANTITDITYAQTVIQLDGTISNCYAQAILDRSDRDKLLKLHEKSVAAAERQWRSLLKFVASTGTLNIDK